LLAIKLASFGDGMDILVTCPECKKEFETRLSIRSLLSEIKTFSEQDGVVRIDDNLVINVRPYSFQSKTMLDLATFEETKLYQHLLDANATDEDKIKMFNESYEKIADLNLDIIADCIVSVSIPGVEVREPDHIREYVRNCDNNIVKKLREKLVFLSECGITKEVDVVCPEEVCQHHWSTPLVFDPAHFFG